MDLDSETVILEHTEHPLEPGCRAIPLKTGNGDTADPAGLGQRNAARDILVDKLIGKAAWHEE